MRFAWSKIAVFLLLLASLNACQPKEPPFRDPEGWIAMQIPEDNQPDRQKIALGRQLFFDPVLSLDSTVSCGSCHHQELAFTDGAGVSTGVNGRMGVRSSMSLLNVGYYYKGLFWDGRSASLEEQAFHPVRDEREMGSTWAKAVSRLRSHPYYGPALTKAFALNGPEEIDSMLVAKALAQYERSLISSDSRFDQVMRGETDFTLAEMRGWTIFFDASLDLPHAECNHCHIDPLFTNLQFHNNGISPQEELIEDPGLYTVTGHPSDLGKFRVPSLRNIALTAPYMHDGRFETLEEVIDHYASGGHYAENVSPNVRPLNLSEADKADLISFLQTLTDTVALNNQMYGNPFY